LLNALPVESDCLTFSAIAAGEKKYRLSSVFFLLANNTEYNGKEPIQEKKIMRNHVPVGFLE